MTLTKRWSFKASGCGGLDRAPLHQMSLGCQGLAHFFTRLWSGVMSYFTPLLGVTKTPVVHVEWGRFIGPSYSYIPFITSRGPSFGKGDDIKEKMDAKTQVNLEREAIFWRFFMGILKFKRKFSEGYHYIQNRNHGAAKWWKCPPLNPLLRERWVGDCGQLPPFAEALSRIRKMCQTSLTERCGQKRRECFCLGALFSRRGLMFGLTLWWK